MIKLRKFVRGGAKCLPIAMALCLANGAYATPGGLLVQRDGGVLDNTDLVHAAQLRSEAQANGKVRVELLLALPPSSTL